jgi:predicted dienelactone hydrolase
MAVVIRRSLLTGGPVFLAACSAFGGAAFGREYDPTVPGPQSAAADHVYELTVQDAARERAIPVRIAHGARRERMPVILFSHGLGGHRGDPAYLERRWRQRGYVTVFMQHPGSDDAVWRGAPPGARGAALRAAFNDAQLYARMRDVAAVLDTLALWQAARAHRALWERMDLGRIGMAGHSFGARTAQAVAGQGMAPGMVGAWPDPRIKAALMLSPILPAGMTAQGAFGGVGIPWMLMTGTHDFTPRGTVDDRLAVFPALPAGRKYQLVLDQAEHSAFTDGALPGDRLRRDPAHHRAVMALSTAFWDATLRGDPAAAAWLDGNGPATVLAAGDRWARK